MRRRQVYVNGSAAAVAGLSCAALMLAGCASGNGATDQSGGGASPSVAAYFGHAGDSTPNPNTARKIQLTPAGSAPALNAACEFVTAAEVKGLVGEYASDALGRLASTFDSGTTCTYAFDAKDTWIVLMWTVGGKVDGMPNSRLPGFDLPTYWIDLPEVKILEVARPLGVFKVMVSLPQLGEEQKAIAIDLASIAEPRLP